MAFTVQIAYEASACRRAARGSVTIGTPCTAVTCAANATTACVADFAGVLANVFGNESYFLQLNHKMGTHCEVLQSAYAFVADGECHVLDDGASAFRVAVDSDGSVNQASSCDRENAGFTRSAEDIANGTCVVDVHKFVLKNVQRDGSGFSHSQSRSTPSTARTPAISNPDQAGSKVHAKSTSNTSAHSNTGIIIGILCAILVVAVIAFLVVRRKRQRDSPPSSVVFTKHPTLGSPQDAVVASDMQLQALRMDATQLTDIRLLGRGAFCVVWLVQLTELHKNSYLAAKRLKDQHPTREQVYDFVKEIKLSATLVHPQIVQLRGVAWTSDANIQALFEYMKHGDLTAWLQEATTPKSWTRDKLQIAADVCAALMYVHSFSPPIVHRDLKSSNVLLANNIRAKLGDFGIARLQSSQATMTVGMGTILWLAPEVLAGRDDYDHRCDIFSFGVVLSELDTHELPYNQLRSAAGNCLPQVAIAQRVASGSVIPMFSASCPAKIFGVAQRCLALDPTQRPTAQELHALFTNMARNTGAVS